MALQTIQSGTCCRPSTSGSGGVSRVYEQNNITFTNVAGDYFGKVIAPRTGTLTFDITKAVTGGVAVVYYINATLDMPEVWLLNGEFVPDEINVIYLVRDSEGYITANILNFGEPTIPAPPTMLTLTQGEIDPETLPEPPTDLLLLQGEF